MAVDPSKNHEIGKAKTPLQRERSPYRLSRRPFLGMQMTPRGLGVHCARTRTASPMQEHHALAASGLCERVEKLEAAMAQNNQSMKRQLGFLTEEIKKNAKKQEEASSDAAREELRLEFTARLERTDKLVRNKQSETRNLLEELERSHHVQHAQHASALEKGISDALEATHKLHEEMAVLKGEQSESHGSLQRVLLDLTKQVESIDGALQKEQEVRLAGEERLDKACNELQRNVSDALQESNTALRMELTSHSKNADEMKAAMQEAQKTLSEELNDHKVNIQRFTEISDKKHAEMRNALEELDQSHHDKHAQNASALQQGISDALEATHRKVQEAMAVLKGEHIESHGSLQQVLLDVTKQVESIDGALQKEQEVRLAGEERLDKACNELQRNVSDALQESNTALRMEFASHGKHADEMKAAMQESHKALLKELDDHESRSILKQKVLMSLESAAATTTAQVQALEDACKLLSTKCEQQRQNIESRVEALASHVSTRTELAEKNLKEAGEYNAAKIDSHATKYDESLECMKRQVATAAAASEAHQQDVKQQIQAVKADAMHQVAVLVEQMQTQIDAADKSMQIRLSAAEKSLNRHEESWVLERQESIVEQAKVMDKKLVQMERSINAVVELQIHETKSHMEKKLSDAARNLAQMSQSIHSVHSSLGQEMSKYQSQLMQTTQSHTDLKAASEQAIADIRSRLGTLSRVVDNKISDEQVETKISSLLESLSSMSSQVASLKTALSSGKEQLRLLETRASEDGKALKQQLEMSMTSMRQEIWDSREPFASDTKLMKQHLEETRRVVHRKLAELEARAKSLQDKVERSASLSELETSLVNVRREFLKSTGTLSVEISTTRDVLKQELSNLQGTCAKHEQDQMAFVQLVENLTIKASASVSKQLLETTVTNEREKVALELNALKDIIGKLSEQIKHTGAMLEDKSSKAEVDQMVVAIHGKLAPLHTRVEDMSSKKELGEVIAFCEREMAAFNKALRTKVSECDIIGIRSMIGDSLFNMQASVLAMEQKQKTLESTGLDLVGRCEVVEGVIKESQDNLLEVQQHLSKQVSITIDLQKQVSKITTLEESWNELACKMREVHHKASREDVRANLEGLRNNIEAALEAFDADVQRKLSTLSSSHSNRLQNDIGDVRTQVSELEFDVNCKVSSLKIDMTHHKARIDDIDSAVNTLEEITAEALGIQS